MIARSENKDHGIPSGPVERSNGRRVAQFMMGFSEPLCLWQIPHVDPARIGWLYVHLIWLTATT